MKREISVLEHAGEIMQALRGGVLLTTKAGERVNAMTISWGALGIEWGVPIFTVFVREGRFTRQLLDENPEFTIAVPRGDFDKKILGICGSRSGRDADKIAELGLTLEAPSALSVPGIRELPLTLECKVVYRQRQEPAAVSEENRARFYPQAVDSSFSGSNRDYHIAYCGEVAAAYVIE